MKVSEIMVKTVFTVSENTPIKEVSRLIFGLGIGGIPVIKDQKLVGIITEKEILSKMYPTMEDLIEDYVHARDFEQMEKNLKEILESPASNIMNRKVTSIGPDTPIMQAQSMMLINKFSRVPVVDRNGKLLGIVSQGDIFRHLIKEEIPALEKENYANFIAKNYDLMVNWAKRYQYEFPALFSLFKKEKVQSIIDLGVWTGEYTIELARKTGFKILGLDHNPIMVNISKEKEAKIPLKFQKNLDFQLTNFSNLSQIVQGKYDAAICMGGSLPYIPAPLNTFFGGLGKVLRDKNPLLVMQILNFEKIIKTKARLLSFKIQPDKDDPKGEHLFMEFFETNKDKCIFHHVVIFDFDGKNWIFKGITTIELCHFTKEEIMKSLKNSGFNKISTSGSIGEYQGEFGELSFDKPFDPAQSDWLNIVARR